MLTETELFALALGVKSPWNIEGIRFEAEAGELHIQINYTRGSKFFYEDSETGEKGEYPAYDSSEKRWRHLNFFQYKCYLNAWIPRVKLKSGKVRQVQAPWEGLSNGFTLLFEALILQFAKYMPVNGIKRITGESNQKLWTVLERYVELAHREQDWSEVKQLAVDETSSQRGHDYVTVVADPEERRVLFATEGKDKTTLERFKGEMKSHKAKPKQIKQISMDMSPAFISAAAEQFPKASVVYDRFHVMQLVNRAVDEVRRAELKEHPALLKGKRYHFLKNEQNLTNRQKQELDEMKMSKLNLKSVRALALKIGFQSVYTQNKAGQFETKLLEWVSWARRCRLEPFKALALSIRRHLKGIIAWTLSNLNNGFMEGMNSVFQAAKAKARGYGKNFITMIYLIGAKLNFNNINPYVTHSIS
ncbi:MAG: ISL3 family transposase [Bacteroidetes bacterium]|nr:ISL3 family transposase [Bacteroidota bacterium]